MNEVNTEGGNQSMGPRPQSSLLPTPFGLRLTGVAGVTKTLIFFLGVILWLSLSAFTTGKYIPPIVVLNPDAVEAMKREKGYWIEVQIPQRRLVLAKGDHIIRSYPVAVGAPDFPTPVGTRRIDTIVWNPWWYPPPKSSWVEDPTPIRPRSSDNPLGEIKMPIGRDNYLIHGTKAVDSIGRWASHGCIRMLFEDLFGIVQLLMTEYTHSSAIDMMERANRESTIQFATSLTRSVPVVLDYHPVVVHDGYVALSPDLYKKIPDMIQLIADTIAPHLKKQRQPSLKKIKNVLKMFKDQTIQVPLESLASKIKGAESASLAE